ncbi:MAG: hypothetical protein WCB86_10270 [Candidatus Dormiibacterota bacterium]
MRNWLVRPPYSENPPAALSFDAHGIGLLFAIWSLLVLIEQSLLFGQLLVSIGGPFQMLQTAEGNLIVDSQAGLVVGAVVSLVGGVLMYRRRRLGRSLVVYGLLLGVACQIANLVAWRPPLISVVEGVTGIAILGLFYLVVVWSRENSSSGPVSGGAEAVLTSP